MSLAKKKQMMKAMKIAMMARIRRCRSSIRCSISGAFEASILGFVGSAHAASLPRSVAPALRGSASCTSLGGRRRRGRRGVGVGLGVASEPSVAPVAPASAAFAGGVGLLRAGARRLRHRAHRIRRIPSWRRRSGWTWRSTEAPCGSRRDPTPAPPRAAPRRTGGGSRSTCGAPGPWCGQASAACAAGPSDPPR